MRLTPLACKGNNMVASCSTFLCAAPENRGLSPTVSHGMPLVAHLDSDVWEVRIRLETRIARILFALEGNIMVLLHGFIKKQQKTPRPELDLAKERLKQLRRRT